MSTQPITRRQAVKAAGAVTAAYFATPTIAGALGNAPTAIAATSCARLTPELTEGPYWVNTALHRSNVRTNSGGGSHQSGVPLGLYINVVDSNPDCRPLNGVAVDIWHANAYGIYSDESSQASGGGDNTSAEDTANDNFLRGYQITGKDKGLHHKPVNGQVSFQTIWPGWYTSRAIHIHVRVRKLHSSGQTIAGYTTQIFFSDTDNDHIFNYAGPYNSRDPKDDPTTDENDTVLTTADFATNIVTVHGSIAKGYTATFNIALDNSEVDATGTLARPNTGSGGSGPGGTPPGA
jgi:protocatechuate 3,4-dioxygenase beta subunit